MYNMYSEWRNISKTVHLFCITIHLMPYSERCSVLCLALSTLTIPLQKKKACAHKVKVFFLDENLCRLLSSFMN